MIWQQHYNPLGSPILSTLVAAIPVVILLAGIAFLRIRIHRAAALGLAAALLVAFGIYGMPWRMGLATAAYGAAYGLFPIGWIILNVIFLYQLTVDKKLFEVLRNSLSMLTPDPRIQVILIAFAFGAFIEGLAGFGTPVAITAAILIQLGFAPLQASGLALIANTAPVAFGSLGIPITTLSQVTGMDALALSKMVGRQLPLFSLIVPFWVVAAFAGWRGIRAVWPAALTAGVAFAVPQFLVSNFHGPWLVDMVSGACAIVALVVLLRRWHPALCSELPAGRLQAGAVDREGPAPPRRREVARAWMPWIILTLFLFVWGLPASKSWLEGRTGPLAGSQALVSPEVPMPGLHLQVQRTPPVVPPSAAPEKAIYRFNWVSATGTGILGAAILAGWLMGYGAGEMARVYGRVLWRVRFSLITIAGMLALGNVTKYSGADATMGLALAHTGSLYPFFGTLLGWLGVALTGSDTASNVLFGSLQKITAEQAGISPILMGAANSSGGVMGKMIDAQSIVVASTATGFHGQEGSILRFVFWHSIALACLVGIWVYLQATVAPFTHLVVR
ncbi:MAG TPA: L-lactate permease [Candidatus Paceibacterota bacterium]|nr:L-lactate permease [Verrucomicrobiota bacterium]HOX02458.1 L-lactate permease [Verrucomicrobiota bacterium]HRZ44892.1 L-lactate permease [Candidatus Paceibacterota bacterium]HRZ91524.1 L-lactate permease [Candidatus Paceibacterota bacterium]